jgi:hypothetical protein
VVTVRPILATAALAAVLASTLVATPAFADSAAADLTAVQDAFAAPDGTTLTLDADIASASTVLTLAADGVLTLDLAGHDLTLRSIILGTGSNLTITDSNADAPGTLTADATDGYVPQHEASACPSNLPGSVGIRTTGATLTITGFAHVAASGGPGSSGIGGTRDGSGGTVTIGGHSQVTAYASRGSGAIGGGCHGNAGTISITDHATVVATADSYGVSIGSGYVSDSGTITIDGDSDVTTVGIGYFASGIGASYGGNATSIGIGGNAIIHSTLDTGRGISTGVSGTITIGGSSAVTIAPTVLGAMSREVVGITTGLAGVIQITDDASVVATAGHTGSAIGDSEQTLIVDGHAIVDARGSDTAPAISITRWTLKPFRIGSTAAVTVSGGSSAVPALRVNASGSTIVTEIDGALHIAAGAVAEVGATETWTGTGVVDGLGSVENLGTITIPQSHVGTTVTGHNYSLGLAPAGGTVPGGVTSVRILATTLGAVDTTLPTPARAPAYAFNGWFTPSGENVVGSSVFTSNTTLTAKWIPYPNSIQAPTIVGAPTVHAQVGTILSATLPIQPDAGTPTIQWKRDSKSITGETEQTYTLAPADIGHSVHVTVTYHRDGYSNVAKASSYLYSIVAGRVVRGVPTIDGDATVGSTLTAHPGDWLPTTTFLYQWYSDGVAISHATHSTYTVSAAKDGRIISVHITARTPGYHSERVLAETQPISDLPALTPGTVTVTGTAVQGTTLTATVTPWAPTAKLRYQWYSDGHGIVGATSFRYVPSSATIGTHLTARVTGTLAGHTTTSAESEPTDVVLGTFNLEHLYLSNGKYKVGRTVEVFTLSPNRDVTYTFQWTRKLHGVTTEIAGATQRDYVITTDDRGAVLQARITMTKAGYVDLTRTTKNTITVSTG